MWVGGYDDQNYCWLVLMAESLVSVLLSSHVLDVFLHAILDRWIYSRESSLLRHRFLCFRDRAMVGSIQLDIGWYLSYLLGEGMSNRVGKRKACFLCVKRATLSLKDEAVIRRCGKR